MKTADFDFDLPRELIAQRPAAPRDSARLLDAQGRCPPEDSGGITNAWMWLAAHGTPAPDGVDVTDPTQAAPVLWTDDFSNLIRVLR